METIICKPIKAKKQSRTGNKIVDALTAIFLKIIELTTITCIQPYKINRSYDRQGNQERADCQEDME